MLAITLLSHINIRFIIFSGSYHSPFLSVFIGDEKPRKPHEMRRKRAIILFACQSFAWFTSKDEVTNRLTASANYGVSAIENYVPPKQFTPGQTVKKEEAVVNTGSIDAFVKQKITGDMKVSVEVPTVTAPDKDTGATQNYLELDSQERFGTYEAGSTLAWAPDGSKYRQGDKMKDGGLIIDYGIDGTTATNNDFNPDKTGLYIFRRAIVKNDNNEATNYEYVGYYYVEETDKYYKLYALTVPKTILDEDSDGLLKGTPTVSYSRKIETDIQKVDMTFLEPTDTDADGNQYGDYRLKVQYSTDDIVNGEVANEARKANAQQVYDNYNAYLDYLQGATTYVPTNSWTYAATTPRATDLRAHDASNPSGLIDHDIYLNQSADTKNPDNASLTNFSYRRLEDLKYGNYGQTSYDTAATDGARVFVTKKDGSDTSTTVADSAKKGLMGLYNYYSPVMNAYNSVYGAFTPYDSTTAGGGVNSATVPTTVQGAWDAAQNEANRSRQLINTGINAAADLATVKSEVETAIGRDYSGTATTSGLKLTRSGATTEDPVGTNTWEANNVYTDALTNGDHYAYNENGQAPLVAFNSETTPTDTNLIAFAKTSAGLDTADKIQEVLSADTVFEERFKDVADGNFGAATGAGSQVKFTVDESNRPASSGTLKTKWDAYVAQTKRKMLIDKKIELVQSCIQNTNGVALPGADITVSETDAARDIEEAQRALVLLKKEKAEIMVDYNKAEKDYQDASKAVADKIKKMNELQRMVDAANKEYISDLNGVNKLQTTAAANDFYYPTSNPTNETGDAIITTVTKGGVADSPVETILKNCLTNTYGVAHKADAPAPTYTSATNPAIYQTYSQAQTKTDIDKYTTANDNGTTTFDVPTAGFNTSEFQHDGTEDATETAVKNAPYFRLNQADNMMTYRKKQADDKKAAFDAAAAQMALFDADETSSSEGIVLYIGLGDVFYNVPNIAPTEDTDEHKWMYVGDATETKSAKEFDFGYTSILEAGETSSQLIKYVKFDDAVTQKDFLDMTFDVNVGVESAQVAYNGTIAGAEAARSSLTPIVPSAESYVTSDKVVGWVAKDGNVGPTDTDPDPKTEATDAVGTIYNVKANGVDDQTVTKITPVVIEGAAYEYKYDDGTNVYYGQSATGTFKKVVNDAAATKEFADSAEDIEVTNADPIGTKELLNN